jgi:DNA-binding LacI/PurR family transcriptional regulator
MLNIGVIKRMPTQKEIAKKLNISHVAVSYAMNGLPGVSNATRKKVLLTAKEMGYMPNAGALAIQSGKFNAISLVMSHNPLLSYQSQGLLSGLIHGVSDIDYTMNINYVPEKKITNQADLPQILKAKISDGIILYYNRLIPAYLKNFLEIRMLPTVWVNSNTPTNAVYADDSQASELLTEHLIGLGHKNILYLDFDASHSQVKSGDFHYSNIEREEAFIQTMKNHGLKPESFRFEVVPKISESNNATRELLRRHNNITAIICYTCHTALHIRSMAAELGLNCPKDISIVAFKEEGSLFDYFDITAAVIPHNVMGRKSIEMVINMIKNNKLEHESIKIPTKLDIRHTSAKVKTKNK